MKVFALAIAAFLIAIANPVLSQPNIPLDPEVATDSSPVMLDGQTLFSIQTGLQVGENLYSPAERAKLISYRIEEVATDSSIPIDAIRQRVKTT